jgi:Tfp pilus assembly protein PilE
MSPLRSTRMRIYPGNQPLGHLGDVASPGKGVSNLSMASCSQKIGWSGRSRIAGFSLVELLIVCVILMVIMGAITRTVAEAIQRSQFEEVRMDLTQQAREFVDEFQRDLHQSGYPNCEMYFQNCKPYNAVLYSSNTVAAGLVHVDNTQVVFEADVDGSGTVSTVRYRLVDSNQAFPRAGNCPCTIQRSQQPKANDNWIAGTGGPAFSQELNNVANSGISASTTYGSPANLVGVGLPITGNMYGYGALTNIENFPVFTAYDQTGAPLALPLDITTAGLAMHNITAIRFTVNLIGNQTTGTDLKTGNRPVMTLVGNGRINNNFSNY